MLTLPVAVETPQHSGLAGALSYQCERALTAGMLVRVPLGRREVLGVVWGDAVDSAAATDAAAPHRPQAAPDAPATPALRPVLESFDALPPLPAGWRLLVEFAAGYYQRGLGELALAVLPPELRKLDGSALARRLKRLAKGDPAPPPGETARPARRRRNATLAAEAPPDPASPASTPPESAPPAAAAHADDTPGQAPAPAAPPALSDDQQSALQAILAAIDGARPALTGPDDPTLPTGPSAAPPAAPAPKPLLLWGSTGSGKTEVYLRAADAVLQQGRQALVLVPEINLTPQLEARFVARFAGRRIVAMHSGLTPAQRLQHWLAALTGRADIVLGTRMAVFAPLPRLGLVVVDEEHDASYKQQEGARYSARDLAIYRGHLERVPVILGSATPSLETWHRAEQGRYQRLTMAGRIGGGALPPVRILDMGQLPRPTTAGSKPAVLAPPVLQALRERIARGEQSLVFLNRRGYAPVLHCTDCGWKSGCPHCSAWRVFHKGERTLRCHHCGLATPVPRACPDCGNLDIAPIGRGTEQLEEHLQALLPEARIARLDADTARGKGELESRLAEVHAGAVDVLVGTQMVTKGHDFRRITLVVAVNPDTALFAADFRAPERLFALLMQAAGRAGRDAAAAERSEVWIQTWNPQHPLYAALKAHDYPRFARQQLSERESAAMPPYSHLALLRAESREAALAQAFLQDAQQAAADLGAEAAGITVYPPVPATLAKLADLERVQMLVESPSRPLLQQFLAQWLAALHALKPAHKRVARWAVDIDPLSI